MKLNNLILKKYKAHFTVTKRDIFASYFFSTFKVSRLFVKCCVVKLLQTIDRMT